MDDSSFSWMTGLPLESYRVILPSMSVRGLTYGVGMASDAMVKERCVVRRRGRRSILYLCASVVIVIVCAFFICFRKFVICEPNGFRCVMRNEKRSGQSSHSLCEL